MKNALFVCLACLCVAVLSGCCEKACVAPAAPCAPVCSRAGDPVFPPVAEPVPISAQPENPMVADKDLLHRRFVLVSLDGEPIVSERRQPDIEFLEGMRIAGTGCNRFMAPGKLENGVLKATGPVAGTMMMCVDPALNRLDQVIPRMLEAGVAVELAGDTLTLSGDGHVLVYALRDWVR